MCNVERHSDDCLGLKAAHKYLTWIIRPMTMTMATQDTMSAWFWMTNSWLSMGKFLLAAAFLPFNGAIYKGLAVNAKSGCHASSASARITRIRIRSRGDERRKCYSRTAVDMRVDYIENWKASDGRHPHRRRWPSELSVWQLSWPFTGC